MNEIEEIKRKHSISDDSEAFKMYVEKYQNNNDGEVDVVSTNAETDENDEGYSAEEDGENALETDYYFIIDEINRADLSKVFGEIMYCLDEDYRGPENRIQTQYSALKTYDKDSNGVFNELAFDCFENGFFIPLNLHIIGTMNDIDRSVESFDFALRRRFIWKEVEANKSLDELDEMFSGSPNGTNKLISVAKEINNLLISSEYKKLGLSKDFFLGKAYYKKFDGTQDSINLIYKNKVEPIIKEYTRGRDSNVVEKLLAEIKTKLDSVLFNTPTNNNSSNNSNDLSESGDNSATSSEETNE